MGELLKTMYGTRAPSGKDTVQKCLRAVARESHCGVLVSSCRSTQSWAKADDKKVSLLNRLIELRVESGERVLRFEPDPRHVQIALHDLGLDKKNVKPLSSPGPHDHEFTCHDESPEEERTKFRSITMRPVFMAQDLAFYMQPVKEAARKMQMLSLGSWKRLKKISRYLVRQFRHR